MGTVVRFSGLAHLSGRHHLGRFQALDAIWGHGKKRGKENFITPNKPDRYLILNPFGGMADAEAAWPAPPPFYRQGRREPPAPVEGEFTMYGVTRSTSPPPPAVLERQLYSLESASPAAELRRLNRSLLGAFVELVETDGKEAQSRVDHLQHLLLNFHHLLNSLRPQQAELELSQILQRQIEYKEELIGELLNTPPAIEYEHTHTLLSPSPALEDPPPL